MKKTTIIAIFLVYLASILIVQFFGLQVMEMQGNEYVSDIVVHSLTLTNRTEEQNQEVKAMQNDNPDIDLSYAFKYIKGEYTADEESLASNPNRVKVNYEVKPYNAANKEVRFVYENTNVVFLEETCEFVFLKKSGATITMRASDASQVSVVLQIIPIY
jgi:hypothetical protein